VPKIATANPGKWQIASFGLPRRGSQLPLCDRYEEVARQRSLTPVHLGKTSRLRIEFWLARCSPTERLAHWTGREDGVDAAYCGSPLRLSF